MNLDTKTVTTVVVHGGTTTTIIETYEERAGSRWELVNTQRETLVRESSQPFASFGGVA